MIEIAIPSWARLSDSLFRRLRQADRDWTIALGLFALAVLLRVAGLVEIPPGLHGDEAWTGLRVHDLLQGARIGPFDPLHGLGQPAGMEYLTAGFTRVFGSSILTIRLPMALLGAATVPLTFGLVRLLQGRTAGVLAALLLSVMGWHLHYSRIALPPVSAPFFEILTSFLFVLAMRSRSRRLFGATGLSLGCGVYSYSSYNIFILVFALFAIYWIAIPEREHRRELLTHSVVLIAAALVAVLPMLLYIVSDSETYLSYPRGISIFNSPQYHDAGSIFGKADVVLDAGRVYVQRIVFDPMADFSDATWVGPMVDLPMAVLLGLGLLYALARWREPLPFLCLLAVLIVPWSGILTVDPGIIRRTIGVTPYIAILAALPLAALIEMAERESANVQRASYALAFFAIVIIGGLDLHAYYSRFPDSDPAQYVFAPELVAASEYMKDLPSDTQVYFYSDQWSIDYETRRYLAPSVVGEDRSVEFSKSHTVTFETDRKQDLLYMLMAPYLDRITELERVYPGGTSFVRKNGDEDPYFIAYYLPALQPGETPAVPLPTFVPTPTLTPAPGGADRDAQRQLAFVQLQQALAQYKATHGSYPSTDGGIQTLCVYRETDVGCLLEETLKPIPQDPLGEGGHYGYFYSSDGPTYVVYAYRETEEYAACTEHPDHLADLADIMCLKGS